MLRRRVFQVYMLYRADTPLVSVTPGIQASCFVFEIM